LQRALSGFPTSRILAVTTVACLLAVGTAIAPASADTGAGVDAFALIGGHSLDAGFEQLLESALDAQFAGIEVAVVNGRLILSGYASPGVHTALLAIVANLLQNPIPFPVELDVITPNLGLGLPFLDAGLDLELPDLSALVNALNVVDHVRTLT